MTPAEYHAAIRAFGLTQTKVPGVYKDADGEFHNVRDPTTIPPKVRAGRIRLLRVALGVEEPGSKGGT